MNMNMISYFVAYKFNGHDSLVMCACGPFASFMAANDARRERMEGEDKVGFSRHNFEYIIVTTTQAVVVEG